MSDFFGGYFDFNDDGNTDILEKAVGLNIIEDIEKKCNGKYDGDMDFDNDDDCDDDDFDSYSDSFDNDGLSDYGEIIGAYSEASECNALPPQTKTDSYGYDDERYENEKDKTPAKTERKEPEPVVWTKSYYLSRRETETNEFLKLLLLFAALLSLPFCMFIFGFTYIGGDDNYVEDFICGLSILAAAFLSLWLLYMIIKLVCEYVSTIRVLAYNLIMRGEEAEVRHFKKMRMVKRISAIVITLGIISAIALPLTMNYASKDIEYNAAQSLVWSHNYTQAVEKLDSLEDENYKDTQALMSYCLSHIKYEQGDFKDAYLELRSVTFKHQNENNMKEIEEYRNQLSAMYDSYTDNYYKTLKTETTTAPTKYKATTKSNRNYNSKIKRTDSDPYDAKAYGNAEDFYYDHYDDFFDYEDAEDYYNEYGE